MLCELCLGPVRCRCWEWWIWTESATQRGSGS